MIHEFLSDITPRPLAQESYNNIIPWNLFFGKGNSGIEIVTFKTNAKPSNGSITKVWSDRRAGRATPIVAIIFYEDEVALCGPEGEDPPIVFLKDIGQAERICRSLLESEDRHSAIRSLQNVFPSLETNIPGFINQGLFATHSLEKEIENKRDDKNLQQKSSKVLDKKGSEILSALGFKVERLDNLTNILRGNDEKTALAVMLNEGEMEESGNTRFNDISPVSYALTRADKENLDWAIFIQKDRIRLYSTRNIGVSKRGRSEAYLECQLSLISEENLSLLWLIFSSEALIKNGTVNQLLENSKRFSGDLANKLRERIYDSVVPELANGITDARKLLNPTIDDINLTYEMALTILFRMLFIAYAEDRDLLPYKNNEIYRKRSLKQKAQELSKKLDTDISQGSHHWNETLELFRAIYYGNKDWGVPEYAGTIFSNEKHISEAGFLIDNIRLDNQFFEKALKSLITIESEDSQIGPVDFRSLSVREFGTIYEGLLESELSLAEFDLTRDAKQNYIPAKDKNNIYVKKGEVYLHDKSGARKSSGSFFTPDFAVEHLLDKSLEPALESHLKKLDGMDDLAAADELFNFRVADIAMGSGHFLVAAIDRIEMRFTEYLDKRPLALIKSELNTLKISALNQLKELSEQKIEDIQLLKRLIARRCIYGLDLNPLSVQLARLSIWIHTFVPGLPLSLLDHSIRQGNSLVGVGSIDEIKNKIDEAKDTLFAADSEALIKEASQPLMKFAKITDATISDVNKARDLISEAKENIESVKVLCDLITSYNISDSKLIKGFPFEDWENRKDTILQSPEFSESKAILQGLSVFHFPIEFPEVFLFDMRGFHVILGNPPWQEITVEKDAFWARYFPGLGGLNQREQEQKKVEYIINRPDLEIIYNQEVEEADKLRKFLVKSYDGVMGTGDPDLYKAFCIRFIKLSGKKQATLGLVLPRSAFSSKGSYIFRRELLAKYANMSLTILKNKLRWVFEDVSEQYTFVLLSCMQSSTNNTIKLKGPIYSLDHFHRSLHDKGVVIEANQVEKWNDTLSFPALTDEQSAEIFLQLRKAPRLDLDIKGEWRIRPDRELDATLQKSLMDLESEDCPEGFWPVYKGASFNLWQPDTGEYKAWANPLKVLPWLQTKRLKSSQSSRNSVHSEFDQKYIHDERTLSPNKPRIVFRDISRATDPRTILTSLIPDKCFLDNTAIYLHFVRGSESDMAYVLGVMSSIPFDWYARRFVEIHVNLFIFNPFPIPRPKKDNPLYIRVIELSGRLACPDDRFKEWANKVGVECGPIEESDKEAMIYELDALVAHLYGLSESQLVHIFETFHQGWDYANRLEKVIDYFRQHQS